MDDQKNEPEVKEQAPEPAESPVFRADELLQDAAHASSKDKEGDTRNLVSQGALPQLDLFDPDLKPADGREAAPTGKRAEEKEPSKDGHPAGLPTGSEPSGQEKNRDGKNHPDLQQALSAQAKDAPENQKTQQLADQVTRDQHSNREIRIDKDNKYYVRGADGQEREFVPASQGQEPNAAGSLGGGAIINQSNRPILAVGDGRLMVVPPNSQTNPNLHDYDGIVTSPEFQPVTLPDGTVLMPKEIPADAKAQYAKIPDGNRGVVGKDMSLTLNRENFHVLAGYLNSLRGRNPAGHYPTSEYTGGGPLRPGR